MTAAPNSNQPTRRTLLDRHGAARAGKAALYTDPFGWTAEDHGFATLLRCPGYGDHLEATVDPEIRVRQQGVAAPPGFEDAIGWVGRLEPGSGPHWHVTFAVEDRDATAAAAERFGAEVISTADTRWTLTALVRDPQGAIFTASQFTRTSRCSSRGCR